MAAAAHNLRRQRKQRKEHSVATKEQLPSTQDESRSKSYAGRVGVVWPSVRNNLPIKGWHRQVVMEPGTGWVVWHWPPIGLGEEHSGAVPLRSLSEISAWLAQCNAASLLTVFEMDAELCLRSWPQTTSEVGPSEQFPSPTIDLFVKTALGFEISRSFEFVDDATFWFTHGEYLKTLRRSVAEEIVRQCRTEKARRLRASSTWATELARAATYRDDYNELVLTPACLDLAALKLIHDATQSLDASELRLHATDLLQHFGSGIFGFDLFNPAYCEALASAATFFRARAGHLASADILSQRSLPGSVSLEKMGLGMSVVDSILARLVLPLATHLYAAGGTLDTHVAFFQFGQPEERFDEALVVLEVTLASPSCGDARSFHGSAADPAFPPIEIGRRPVGSALLYGGDAMWRRKPLESGLSLVVWCRSTAWNACFSEGSQCIAPPSNYVRHRDYCDRHGQLRDSLPESNRPLRRNSKNSLVVVLPSATSE